ncbi:MAG TPA: HypC/HybG/HupF family hydrogenase formation chaperone [Acidimicrobiia bacterium]|jgi:hydrogenase expression/formation protein HypC|nr:HypC/HybG/HupF family hydrogenase formation chaperone [Acidimicrobiia bacterium]
MTTSDANRPLPVCHDDVCITCGDVAVPVRIVEVRPGELALVDTGETLEEISIALVDTYVGGRVLVHAKEAIASLPDHDQNDDEADGA